MEKTNNINPSGTQVKMNIWDLLKNILPFVLPYRWLIVVTLVLTLVGSLMAQVNAVVLDRAVDAINALIQTPGGFRWSQAVRILTIISIILLGKEVVGAVVTFFQRYYGERMRILVSRDLSLTVVDRVLKFRMAFFAAEGNDGKASVAYRPWYYESVEYGKQFLHRDIATVHQRHPCLGTDVHGKCLCGIGGTVHHTGIFLGDIHTGEPYERWPSQYLRWTSGGESGNT